MVLGDMHAMHVVHVLLSTGLDHHDEGRGCCENHCLNVAWGYCCLAPAMRRLEIQATRGNVLSSWQICVLTLVAVEFAFEADEGGM
jgi:hypothetical protein